MPDVNFETKFAQIVENELNAKLPSLKQYHVGFQLLDHNDEDNMAVGVNAFLINNVLVYNPVFFLKGKIKGMDLLYVKPRDMFVPAMDNWISALKDQSNSVLSLGKSVSRKLTKDQKSFAANEVPLEEVLYTATSTPLTKVAHANDLLDITDLEKMAQLDSKVWDLSLEKQLKMLPKEASAMFFDTIRNNSDFANAVLRYYSPEDITSMATMIKTASEAPKRKEKTPTEMVTIIDKMDHPNVKDLTYKDRQLFTQNGVFVKDERSNHSVLFRSQIKSSALQNPNHPGIYDVLMNDGSLTPFIIFTDVQGMCNCNPSFEVKTKDCTMGRQIAMISMDDPNHFLTASAGKVFCRPSEKLANYEATKGKMGGSATKKNLVGLMGGGDGCCRQYMFVQPGGKSIILNGTPTTNKFSFNDSAASNSRSFSSRCEDVSIEFTGKPGKLILQGGILVVPSDVKVFSSLGYDNKKHYDFGNLSTVHRVILKEAEVKPLQIYNRPSGISIKSEKGSLNGLDKVAALQHLTLVEGIHGGQAVGMLKEASKQESQKGNWLIKYAFDYDVANAPGVKGSVNTTSQAGPILTTNRMIGKQITPTDFVQKAVESSKSGNQQVFDVTVLKGLIEAADIADIRKNMIVDMVKGLDRVGRLLFIFYWHNDQFEERYGKEDLNNLEDKLKSVFKQLGDLILYLKEKMPIASDTPEHLQGMLSEDIGASVEGSA